MTRRSASTPTTAAPLSRFALPTTIALGLLALVPRGARAGEKLMSLPRTGLYRIVPQRVQFVDGYYIDVQRDPSHFAQPIDTDTIAEVPVWSRPASGLSISAGLVDESKPIGEGGTLMHVFFRYRF